MVYPARHDNDAEPFFTWFEWVVVCIVVLLFGGRYLPRWLYDVLLKMMQKQKPSMNDIPIVKYLLLCGVHQYIQEPSHVFAKVGSSSICWFTQGSIFFLDGTSLAGYTMASRIANLP